MFQIISKKEKEWSKGRLFKLDWAFNTLGMSDVFFLGPFHFW